MPKVHIIYDPTDRLQVHEEPTKILDLKTASLSLPENLEDIDVYNISRKLAEMLLEQL